MNEQYGITCYRHAPRLLAVIRLFSAPAAFVLFNCSLFGAPPEPSLTGTLTGSGLTRFNDFGLAIDYSDNTAIVGARQGNVGSAYLFGQSSGGWTEVAKLLPSTQGGERSFGTSVAIDSDLVVVGAIRDSSVGTLEAGAAYVFARENDPNPSWSETFKLTAGDPQMHSFFGSSLVVQGNTAAVAAIGADGDAGAVYLFETVPNANTWSQVAKITAPIGEQGFGSSVDLSGDTLVIGASKNASDIGSAYIYQRDVGGAGTWGLVAELVQPDAIFGDEYGEVVAIDGDIAVVGAYRHLGNGSNSGKIYIFDRNFGGPDQWGLVQQFAPPDINFRGEFGYSVAIDESTIAVGARADRNGPSNSISGSLYLLAPETGETDPWKIAAKLTAPTPRTDELFGSSVALSAGTLIVGAPFDHFAEVSAVFAYQLVPEPASLASVTAAGMGVLLFSRTRLSKRS